MNFRIQGHSTTEKDEELCLTAKARRPSMFGYVPRQAKKRNRKKVAELEKRFENGLDLWTGLPLTGQNLDDWLALKEREEEFQMPIEDIRAA